MTRNISRLDQEPTAAVDDDTFAMAAHHTAEVLDSPLVRPDTEQFEVLRVPFGRFGDGGTLAADMTWADNTLAGRIIYAPRDKDDKGRIHVSRKPASTSWQWENYDGQVSNAELAERLRADWPPNGSFASVIGEMTDRAFYDTLRPELLRLAPYWQTGRKYRHHQVVIDPYDRLRHESTTTLSVHTHQDGMRRIQLTTARPQTHGDDPMHCRATIDELGTVNLGAYRQDSQTNRTIEVPVQDRPQTLGALLLLLNRLENEKHPL